MTDSDLAEKLDKTKSQVEKKRRKMDLMKPSKRGGFYQDKDKIKNVDRNSRQTEITYSLGKQQKRHLKGKLGEVLASQLKHKLRDFLEKGLEEPWELIFGKKIINEEEIRNNPYIYTYRFSENLDEESLSQNYLWAKPRLAKKYRQFRTATTDRNYYAVKKTEKTKEFTFHSKGNNENIITELQVIDDFIAIFVEIKTIKDGSVKSSLTDTQKETLEKAKNQEKLRFYTMKIKISKDEFKIPENTNIELKRLD